MFNIYSDSPFEIMPPFAAELLVHPGHGFFDRVGAWDSSATIGYLAADALIVGLIVGTLVILVRRFG